MHKNIKECPFCGGIAYLNSNYSYKIRKYFIFVKCEVCGAQGKIVTDNTAPAEDNWKNAKCEQAITCWNNRVNKDSQE